MTSAKLNEETVKRLPIPTKGNRVTYFAGAIIQGAKAPRVFVRVTAAALVHLCLTPPARREHRFTIELADCRAQSRPRCARLRQRVDREICLRSYALAATETSPPFLMTSWLDMSVIRINHCAVLMNTKARLILVKPRIGKKHL